MINQGHHQTYTPLVGEAAGRWNERCTGISAPLCRKSCSRVNLPSFVLQTCLSECPQIWQSTQSKGLQFYCIFLSLNCCSHSFPVLLFWGLNPASSVLFLYITCTTSLPLLPIDFAINLAKKVCLFFLFQMEKGCHVYHRQAVHWTLSLPGYGSFPATNPQPTMECQQAYRSIMGWCCCPLGWVSICWVLPSSFHDERKYVVKGYCLLRKKHWQHNSLLTPPDGNQK